MNDWNQWENQWRSWMPRRPSAKLKERLFSNPPVADELSAGTLTVRWRWLAPALGCLMLLSVTFNPRNSQMAYLAATGTNTLLEVLGGDPKSAAYLIAGFHSDRNGPPSETFPWTNGQRFLSSMGSFPLAKTNSLIR